MRCEHDGYYGGWIDACDCNGVPAGFEPLLEDF
jgi:hypothetical protein